MLLYDCALLFLIAAVPIGFFALVLLAVFVSIPIFWAGRTVRRIDGKIDRPPVSVAAAEFALWLRRQ